MNAPVDKNTAACDGFIGECAAETGNGTVCAERCKNRIIMLILSITLHNIPEGLTIAISMVSVGYSKIKAVFASLLIGLMQPLGAVVGLLLTGIDFDIVPYGMALAGGTMLFVVINEILPETYGQKENTKSVWAVFSGFILMTYIAILFH